MKALGQASECKINIILYLLITTVKLEAREDNVRTLDSKSS